MSNDFNFNDDFAAILSEFSDFSKSLDSDLATTAGDENPTAAAEAALNLDAILADAAKYEAPAAPEVRPAPVMRPAAPKAEPAPEPQPEKPKAPLVKRGVPLIETAKKKPEPAPMPEEIPAPEKKTAKKIEKPVEKKIEKPVEKKPVKEPEYIEPPKKTKKKLSIGQRISGGVIGLIFMAISVLVIAWVGVNVHPNSTSAAATASGTKISLPDKLDGYMNNLAADALSELTYIKKIYTIQESDNAGPMPNESCYGSVPIDRAAEVMQIVEKARTSGLLDGQEVMFSPDLHFYHDTEIKYYCDETILAIWWKEVIDGNTVSCCEVKIADASQFRRKIADDTYGSPNQYYASSLSRQANAVVAMNADFYQFRDFGIVVYQRELYRYSDSNYTGNYSLYNCIDNCFVTASGDFIFMHKGDTITEDELRQFIKDNDVLYSIAFGPILVENGEVQPCTWYPAGEPTTGYSRAGIGVVDKLHYFYMNLNHSEEKAARWTVTQFAEHMHEKGIDTAYGLDGGQTGELLYKHEPFNYIDFGAERLVSDIIYFATAIPSEEVAH